MQMGNILRNKKAIFDDYYLFLFSNTEIYKATLVYSWKLNSNKLMDLSKTIIHNQNFNYQKLKQKLKKQLKIIKNIL